MMCIADKYTKNPWEGISDNIPYYEDKNEFWSKWHEFCYHDKWLLWKTMQSVINMYFLLKNKTDNFIIFDFTSNIKKNISNKTDIRYCWDNNCSSKFIWQKIQKNETAPTQNRFQGVKFIKISKFPTSRRILGL